MIFISPYRKAEARLKPDTGKNTNFMNNDRNESW